jgi:divinyl protochlorophyllide a 8-vinyl-reductase
MTLASPLSVDVPRLEAKAARIGPNTVLQLEQALIETGGDALARRIFAEAGFLGLLRYRPCGMIDEAIPAVLFKMLFASLPEEVARCIASRAGDLTGRYILKHRIPRAARTLLKALPSEWAAPILLRSIARHSWTFAGSGTCTVQTGCPAGITIQSNPLAMPGCAWHQSVFEALMRALVSARTRVRHVTCCNEGSPDCQFLLDWRPAPDADSR